MSDQPEIGGRLPKILQLDVGEYYWCACGRSGNQPFCDGSHAGTSFSPQKLEIEEGRRVALCTCKRTGNAPYCDGTHATLPPE